MVYKILYVSYLIRKQACKASWQVGKLRTEEVRDFPTGRIVLPSLEGRVVAAMLVPGNLFK